MKHKFNSSPNSPVQLAEFSSCGPNSPTSSPNSPKIPLGRIVNGPNSPDPVLNTYANLEVKISVQIEWQHLIIG